MKSAIVLGATSGVGLHIADALLKDHDVHGFHRGHYPAGACYLRSHGACMHEADAGTTFENAMIALDLATLEVAPYSLDVVVHSISGATLGRARDQTPTDVKKMFNRLAHSFAWWVQGICE